MPSTFHLFSRQHFQRQVVTYFFIQNIQMRYDGVSKRGWLHLKTAHNKITGHFE